MQRPNWLVPLQTIAPLVLQVVEPEPPAAGAVVGVAPEAPVPAAGVVAAGLEAAAVVLEGVEGVPVTVTRVV